MGQDFSTDCCAANEQQYDVLGNPKSHYGIYAELPRGYIEDQDGFFILPPEQQQDISQRELDRRSEPNCCTVGYGRPQALYAFDAPRGPASIGTDPAFPDGWDLEPKAPGQSEKEREEQRLRERRRSLESESQKTPSWDNTPGPMQSGTHDNTQWPPGCIQQLQSDDGRMNTMQSDTRDNTQWPQAQGFTTQGWGVKEQGSMDQRPHPVQEQGKRLRVKIIGARGLRAADWALTGGKSDPYCVCEIVGKPYSKVETPVIWKDLNPVWNFESEINDFALGDSLVFNVWDKDLGKAPDFLGKLTLTHDQFYPDGFSGELPLAEAGKGTHAFLCVEVALIDPKDAEAKDAVADIEQQPQQQQQQQDKQQEKDRKQIGRAHV